MKINWKIRLRNPMFWWFVAVTIFTNITVKLNVDPLTLVTWQSVGELIWHSVANPVVLVSTLINVIIGSVDFTTKGICDSPQALTYKELK